MFKITFLLRAGIRPKTSIALTQHHTDSIREFILAGSGFEVPLSDGSTLILSPALVAQAIVTIKPVDEVADLVDDILDAETV